MMKNILVILTFLLSVALTGCGSNSKPDGDEKTALSDVLELQGQAILQDPSGTDFSLTLPFKKLIGEAYLVELNSFSLEVTGGCTISTISYTPTTLKFDGAKDSQETLYVSGAFDAHCTPTGYTLTATQKITSGNQSDTRQVSFSYNDSGSNDPYIESGYSFYNATTPLAISEANTKYPIKVQLLKDGYVAENETIKLRPFDNTYGDIAVYEAVTGSDGYAVFDYTSPKRLPAYGSSVTLTADYFLEDNTTITPKEVVLSFTASPGAEVDTTGMELVAVPGTVNISEAGESRALSLYLANTSTHEPVANQEIKALWFDPNNGTLNSYIATTDSNGQVVFNYIAPETLPASNLDITFEVVNGTPGLQTAVAVSFTASSAPSVDTTHYTMYAVPSSITISEDGESKAISLFLEDTRTMQPVEGQEIIAHFFDPASGTLNAYSGITNTNGQVVFNYTAPASITGATDFNITFSIPNATESHETNVAIGFGSNVLVYILTAEDNVTITDTAKSYPISVALSKKEGANPSQPAVGSSVIAEFVMPMYGTITQYEVLVDERGIATFEFVSPHTISDLNDTNITFYYKNDMTVMDTTLVTYNPQMVESVESIYVVPGSFTVTEPGETQEITIVTVNSKNVGISTTVQLEQPFFNGTDYGSFDETQVTTDVNGKATVTYTAPASLTGLEERNITVTETTKGINEALNIRFGTPQTQGINYEITVDVPQSIAVDRIDQITVKIHELGNPDEVIADQDVHEVNLTSLFKNILTFSNDKQHANYSKLGTNAIEVETKTLSGVAIIEVSADVFNGDHNVTLTTTVPITVLSGEVTAMSIFYMGSSEDGVGQFINTYTIHAVDKYGNPAREGVMLHPSLINGTNKIDPRVSVYGERGTIKQDNTFKDTTGNFYAANVDESDRLVIVPNSSKYDPSYLGNWTLESVSSTELTLSEEYYGSDESSLSYVIGNESRYINGYGVAVADIATKAGGYKTDENGNVQFDVTFDPILAGRTVTIAAHAYDGNRTGVAKIEGLRWGHYNSSSKLLRIDGEDHNVTLSVGISNTANEPLEPLVNMELSHTGIVSTSAQCDINSAATDKINSNTSGKIVTNKNGEFTVVISTFANTGDDEECTIEWNKSNASIYREY